MMSRSREAGESRWAPFVVFGGILAIGLTTTTVVLVNHCNREEPYLDSVKIYVDPAHPRPIPAPKRARPSGSPASDSSDSTPR